MPELVGGAFVVVAFCLFVAVHRWRLTKLQGDVVFLVFLLAFVLLLYLIAPLASGHP